MDKERFPSLCIMLVLVFMLFYTPWHSYPSLPPSSLPTPPSHHMGIGWLSPNGDSPRHAAESLYKFMCTLGIQLQLVRLT